MILTLIENVASLQFYQYNRIRYEYLPLDHVYRKQELKYTLNEVISKIVYCSRQLNGLEPPGLNASHMCTPCTTWKKFMVKFTRRRVLDGSNYIILRIRCVTCMEVVNRMGSAFDLLVIFRLFFIICLEMIIEHSLLIPHT